MHMYHYLTINSSLPHHIRKICNPPINSPRLQPIHIDDIVDRPGDDLDTHGMTVGDRLLSDQIVFRTIDVRLEGEQIQVLL